MSSRGLLLVGAAFDRRLAEARSWTRWGAVLLRVSLLPGLLSASACGGSQAAKPAAAPEAGTAESSEAQCLADAEAPRTPPPNAPESIEVAHVLVRHADLVRPEGATRTRGQACLRALQAREALESGEVWEEVVAEYSDAADATSGSLGTVTRDDLDKRFADAAFALEPNQLSYVVETDRGFHVIVRLE